MPTPEDRLRRLAVDLRGARTRWGGVRRVAVDPLRADDIDSVLEKLVKAGQRLAEAEKAFTRIVTRATSHSQNGDHRAGEAASIAREAYRDITGQDLP